MTSASELSEYNRAQNLAMPRYIYFVLGILLLSLIVVVGIEIYNEMVPALEQCAPNCRLRG
jgi:hypothetical protein